MLSLFPGMDPYLEDPDMWWGVHHRLITFSAEAIQEVLRPGFVADIDERLYVVAPERSIYPEVAVLKKHPEESRHLAPAFSPPTASVRIIQYHECKRYALPLVVLRFHGPDNLPHRLEPL
ncbi:MAG TPA: DUF4058 family protein [Chthonomonadales bacterium]|nr:DUF4058 family protein [Chthonomonadales bacterium]